MKIWLLIITISISTACKTGTPPAPVQTPTQPPLTIGGERQFSGESVPEEIKVRVSISRPEDLRVRVGQKLKTGDAIADRNRERNNLENQRRQAALALERFRKIMLLKNENLEKPVLPDAFFAEYEAAINRAAVAVEAAKRAVRLQEQHLKEIESLPFPFDLSKVKQHESARLQILQGELLAAESNFALERAKLESARGSRSYSEQKDALEIQKVKLASGEQRITLEIQIAQLEAQMTNLDSQIAALAAVRAPFAGVVKKISWEGQTNAEIYVVITVAVDDYSESKSAK